MQALEGRLEADLQCACVQVQGRPEQLLQRGLRNLSRQSSSASRGYYLRQIRCAGTEEHAMAAQQISAFTFGVLLNNLTLFPYAA